MLNPVGMTTYASSRWRHLSVVNMVVTKLSKVDRHKILTSG